MKKNTTYILIGLAVLGGAYYFMKKKKKGIVTVSMPENITQEQFEQTEQPSPIKSLVKAVKKVSNKLQKPKQVMTKQMQTVFDPMYFQGNIQNKDILKNYVPVKSKRSNFSLRPKGASAFDSRGAISIKGIIPNFF